MLITPAEKLGFLFCLWPDRFEAPNLLSAADLKSEETLRYEIRDEDVDDHISDQIEYKNGCQGFPTQWFQSCLKTLLTKYRHWFRNEWRGYFLSEAQSDVFSIV